METMKKTIVLLGILLGIITSSTAAEPTSPQSVSQLELQMTTDILSKPNTFFLWAVNRGKSNVLVIRPRSGMVDHFESWGAWSLRVQGPGGLFIPITYPGGIPPFTSLDLTELRPGESIGVVLNLDHYINNKQTELVNMPGTYTVVAGYYLDQDKVYKVPAETGEHFIAVPRLQPIESRALQFVVQNSK
jgi:hypothetical protein